MITINPATDAKSHMNNSPSMQKNPADPSMYAGQKIPALLRGIGIFAVLLSLYGFFMKGWDGGNDLLRYGMLLGHTLLLAIIGIGSGHLLKEGKGARILLMLALISAVAVFSILGSFIYAAYGPVIDDTFINAMRWNLDGPATTISVTVASIMLLLPVMAIAFRVLSRGISTSMFMLFSLSNLALLIPVRDPAWIAMIALSLGIYTLFFSLKTSRQNIEVKTREGLFVMLLQFAPMATLLVRSLWLHDAVALLYATSCAMGFIALRQLALLLDKTSLLRQGGEWLSAFLALLTGSFLFTAINSLAPAAMAILCSALTSAVMIHELAQRAASGNHHYRTLATLTAVIPLLGQLCLTDDISYLLAILSVGLGMIAMSYALKQRSMLLGGLSLVIAGLARLSLNLWFDFDFNAWIISAVLGVMAIVLGSLLESRGSQLKQQWMAYRQYFAEWRY